MKLEYTRNNQNYYYVLYWNIKLRCYNINNPDYKYYGAKGISLFKNWLSSFEQFVDYVLKELGPRPKNMTLDRIDSTGNYEPGNIRWATAKLQAQNKSNYTFPKHEGITYVKESGTYLASVSKGTKYIFRKRYKTLEAAIAARDNFINEELMATSKN